MKTMLKTTALLTLMVLAASACTRRVQVESEPNEPRYMQSSSAVPAEIDVVGVYDYVVGAGDDVETGPMTVTRTSAGGSEAFVGETFEFRATRRP